MHHRSPRPRTSPTPAGRSVGQRLATRLLQLGAVAGAIAVIGSAGRDEPAERSQSVVVAEDDTRAFLDERAAVHLRRLREL